VFLRLITGLLYFVLPHLQNNHSLKPLAHRVGGQGEESLAALPKVEQHGKQVGIVHDAVFVDVLVAG